MHVLMGHVYADYPLPRKKEASGKLKHQKLLHNMLSKDLSDSCMSVLWALNECRLKLHGSPHSFWL